MSEPFATTISTDYSVDELDAIADAFLRPDLARSPERAGATGAAAVRRAQHQTALRGLVARRAISLGGAPGKPEIVFLEPHATMLGTFLHAGAVATLRREQRGSERAVSLYAGERALVHAQAIPGQGIERLTAHAPGAAPVVMAGELEVPGGDEAAPEGDERRAVDLSRSVLRAAVTAIDAGKDIPSDVPQRAADVLYARRESGSVSISARGREGSRLAGTWTWIDAGALGWWQLVVLPDDLHVRLEPVAPGALRAELLAAWAQVLEESAEG